MVDERARVTDRVIQREREREREGLLRWGSYREGEV